MMVLCGYRLKAGSIELTSLETIHEGKKLGNNTAFNFAISLQIILSLHNLRQIRRLLTFSRLGAIESIRQ